jgi:hypothetical protein
MVSTPWPSQAEQVASNAWLWGTGGCIFADAHNAVTSAAVTVRQISMHRNITPLRGTRLSPASSPGRIGFTTIGLEKSSPARSFTLPARIRWINRCPGRLGRCLQTGKRSFANRAPRDRPRLSPCSFNKAEPFSRAGLSQLRSTRRDRRRSGGRRVRARGRPRRAACRRGRARRRSGRR